MMIAWYICEDLVKRYDDFIYIIENKLLDDWIHNKAIQKAIESYRISKENKNDLKNLKMKKTVKSFSKNIYLKELFDNDL